MKRAAVLLLFAAVACVDEGGPEAGVDAGAWEPPDPAPLLVETLGVDESGELVAPAGVLRVLRTPTGGHWAYVGARVWELAHGTVTARVFAALADVATGEVIAGPLERSIALAGAPDGWSVPESASSEDVVWLFVCDRDDVAYLDVPLELTVRVLADDGREGVATAAVALSCGSRQQCICACGSCDPAAR